MNYKKTCLALSILALAVISAYPLGAAPCPAGNPLSIDYMYRDRNRCEGIYNFNQGRNPYSRIDFLSQSKQSLHSLARSDDFETKPSLTQDYRHTHFKSTDSEQRDSDHYTYRYNGYDLIAFSTGGLTDYSQPVKIRVPKLPVTPNITVQSYVRNYLLDNLSLDSTPSHYNFNLNPQVVLKKANIPPNSLRAIATVRKDSQDIYYPVIFNQAGKYYDLTLYSSTRRAFPQVEIRRQGKVFSSNLKPRKIPDDGEIS
jgi:hypothetical protein